jgi:hypothetical protein
MVWFTGIYILDDPGTSTFIVLLLVEMDASPYTLSYAIVGTFHIGSVQ